jgi:hypothetical protein
MKSPSEVEARTVALWIQELEDGVITPENRAQLMDLMRAHESVRDLYLKHVELSVLIHQAAESRIELGTMPVSIETLRREKRKSALLSLAYAAAAMVVLGLGLLFWKVGLNYRSPSPWIALESSNDAAYAVVRGEQDAQAGDNLMPGDQITLKRGLLQFRFPSGVEAIIEGGCQLELISGNTVRMDGGMGWFRVPANARGFTVRTKLGRVVDLGTEFGIRFDNRSDLEVHVAKGLVKVAPALPGTVEIQVTEGKAMRFDSDGKGVPLELKSSLFRQQFSKQVPHIHWSFNHLIDGAFPARGMLPTIGDFSVRPRRLDGAVIKSADCLTDGIHGKAFSMKGDGLFAESFYPGIEGDAPRTVAAWVRHRGGISTSTSDPRTGLGSTTPFGNQAYLLNYTNAGLTTAQGATGVTLIPGVTYTLTFHAAKLPAQESSEYHVELVAFDRSVDDESRAVASYGNSPGSILATATGLVTTTDMSTCGRVSFTPRADDPRLGGEVGIRLVKSSSSALYDHLRLTKRRGSGPETAVFTEDFEDPVVAGYAERISPPSGWVRSRQGFGASRHGLFSQRPIFATPFVAWGGPASGWAAFALPTQTPRWSVSDGRFFHDATVPLPHDKWTHMATVHTGRKSDDGQPEVLHFIDGDLVPTASLESGNAKSPFTAARMLIGALPGTSPAGPTLDADIDELHILRAALGKEEILSLMERNHPDF